MERQWIYFKEPDLHGRAARRNNWDRICATKLTEIVPLSLGRCLGEKEKIWKNQIGTQQAWDLTSSSNGKLRRDAPAWGKKRADWGKLLLMGLVICREAYLHVFWYMNQKDQVGWVPGSLSSPPPHHASSVLIQQWEISRNNLYINITRRSENKVK